MAALKKSEARLLGIFGLLIFAAITYFVIDIVDAKKKDMIGLQRARAKKIRDYQNLIDTRPLWQARKDFVNQFQPVYRTEEKEAPALEAYFRRAATVEGVEVKKLLPQPPLPLGDSMMAISLQASVSGAGPDVLRFLILLQAENRFYAIPSISIVADRKDPSIVNADLIFSRWFTLDGNIPEEEEEEAVPSGVPTPAPAGTVAENPTPGGAAEATTEPPVAKPPGLIADPSPAEETN